MAVPEGMFSAMHSQPVTLTGRPRPATARTAFSTAAAPAMSHFMVTMPAPGLMEIPPVSKVMPLPTRARSATALFGLVLQLDHARGPGGALANAHDAAVAVLEQALLIEDRDLDRQALGQVLGGLGEGGGVERAGRLVDQGAGGVDGLGHHRGTFQGRRQLGILGQGGDRW